MELLPAPTPGGNYAVILATMKHYLTILSLCVSQLMVSELYSYQINFLDMDLHEVRAKAGNEGKLYFAFFTADWCAPCKWMEDQTFRNPALGQFVREHYLAVRIDIDQRQGRIQQERFQVKMLPSILLFNAQGQLLARIETALSAEDFLKILQEHNLPKNRIGSSNLAVNDQILDSPKPFIKLYRPPLPSEENPTSPPPPSPLPPPVVVQQPSTPAASAPRVSTYNAGSETFAPRSSGNFSVQIASHENYSQAVQQVAQLESGLSEPVRLIGGFDENGQQVFRIFIGIFSEKQKAQDYLYYLRRKNISGIVRDLQNLQRK